MLHTTEVSMGTRRSVVLGSWSSTPRDNAGCVDGLTGLYDELFDADVRTTVKQGAFDPASSGLIVRGNLRRKLATQKTIIGIHDIRSEVVAVGHD
jgi:hypothetical protein